MAKIEIVPYNPDWPNEFVAIAGSIRKAFGPVAVRVDHIGSTSVPGLAAKDVIDLQITVENLDSEVIGGLAEQLGYELHPHIAADHIPPGGSSDPDDWAKLLLRVPASQRRTHVHVRKAGKANQRYPILFRDYLRSNPAAAEVYRKIKVVLARHHPYDVEAYYDVKDPVCDLIIDSAELWAEGTGWTPGTSDA